MDKSANDSALDAVPLNQADDLLSQLAGEEVDRLLAEADMPRADSPEKSKSNPAPIETAPNPEKAVDEMQAQLDALFNQLQGPIAGAPVQAAVPRAVQQGSAVVTEDAATQAELDSLFGQFQKPPEESGPAPAQVDAATDHVEADRLQKLADELEIDVPRENVAEARVDAEPSPPPSEPQVTGLPQINESIDLEQIARSPFWIKPIEWFNFPMWGVSDELRDTVGKVALATLLNALLILGYVFLIRPHLHR